MTTYSIKTPNYLFLQKDTQKLTWEKIGLKSALTLGLTKSKLTLVLIDLKGPFGLLNSSKQQKKKIFLGYLTGRIVFVRFFEELGKPKTPFEIT